MLYTNGIHLGIAKKTLPEGKRRLNTAKKEIEEHKTELTELNIQVSNLQESKKQNPLPLLTPTLVQVVTP